jgi:hypothetical protein
VLLSVLIADMLDADMLGVSFVDWLKLIT